MRFGILGPLEVLDDSGAPVELGGRQPRMMLAALLVAGGRPVSVEALVDAVWGDNPPATATGTLQSYVSRLRRRLGTGVLVWDDLGYRVDVDPAASDHRRFEELADRGRALLDAGDAEGARAALVEAEALWRGPALAEFADLEFATGLATRLEQRRLAAIEDRLDADLRLGHHAAVGGELAELVAAHPLRERLQEQLALSLYRSGRQADALRALAQAGRTLRDELGIEPSRQLRDLEAAILAHDPSLELSAPRAPAAPAPPPAPAAAVSPTMAGTAATDRVTGLVGRTAEFADLVEALDESARDARFVVVEGDPGIGKTRLLDELRVVAEERGALAVWGRSDEGGAAPALWPWLPPLRALADSGHDVPDVLLELLAGETPLSAGQAQSMQFERFEAVNELLTQVAAARPVVVLIDDLQWADATSLELLAFLTTRLGAGVLVAGTMRRLEVGRNDAVTDALAAIARRAGSRRLQLRGLTEADTAVVLQSVAHRSVPDGVAATIHARAEGNPFFAIELARLVDEEGAVGAEVPGGVGDVIRRRVARLPAATADLLGVAAVVGRDVDVNLLARAAEGTLDTVLDALDPAVVHRLLVEVPENPAVLRFSHALVREVLLEDLTLLRRARLHLKVADAIEAAGAGVDDAEILAEHLWRAAPVGVGKRAAQALEQAAEIALRRVSYGAAEDLLTKAVQLRRATGSTLEEQEAELVSICRLLEVARARRYFQGAANLDVLDRAKELAERCGRQDIVLDILWFEWSALATSSRIEEANILARHYIDLALGNSRTEYQFAGHQVHGVLCWCEGRIADAVTQLDKAMAMRDEIPPSMEGFQAEQRMVGTTFWLWNHAAHGDVPDDVTFARFDELLAMMPDRFAVASICGFAATTAISLGRWEDVDRYASIGFEADPGSQFAFWGGQILMQRGVVQGWRGDIESALTSFAAGKALYTGVGGRSALSTFQASLAITIVEHGAIDDAVRLVQAARTELDTYHERWNEPIVLLAEAVVAHATGDTDAAVERLRQAVVVANDQGAHRFAQRAEAVAADLGLTIPA